MDIALFTSLIQNLLYVNVTHFGDNREPLSDFVDKYCYHPLLQPQFTEESLHRLCGDIQDSIIYESRDNLGICALYFRLSGETFLVGPFVRWEADTRKVQSALIKAGLPASYLPSVKNYYSAFPLLSSTHAKNTIISCIRAFSGIGTDYAICRIDDFSETWTLPQPDYSETLDYSTLYRRYDRENRFLRMIEQGDTENVLIAFQDMSIQVQAVSQNRYVNAIYQDPIISLSMLRALSRKAAEKGGVSIIDINEITQRAVQKTISAHNAGEQMEYTRMMILELTEAVRRSQLKEGSFSYPVKKTMEYLRLNFSQDISLSHLTEITGFSASYLSRRFKQETGVSISEYVANLRCEHAAEMLQSTAIPIQDISSFVGYLDSNYFVKVFKKKYNLTPSQYRAQKR